MGKEAGSWSLGTFNNRAFFVVPHKSVINWSQVIIANLFIEQISSFYGDSISRKVDRCELRDLYDIRTEDS